mmetsp:Transcript_17126/g.22284  ORF Transcript_17126/g.22284 Transcript_17126/m.22284 type:complete len:498 (-) Transcript_17126:230-1723(-)|eukprot:CAMPEP_0198144886 /NCGR_PEP_ID=MMETSP1443-20131203/19352_1 /TAXON_ID=186043 /ORGANISM="Entomoneis sp., Strain CCMP2396" /LENGTH=497 /DNA_ID=CAMNT_0043808375 /DNA_START=54 /DNA_END=1547 /DNA_ORIENTATION=+
MKSDSSTQDERQRLFSPKMAFLLVSLALGELGDGLNIFQGVYLVGMGWNEGSVGLALSLMGFTALVIQPWAGDWVDKTTVDRRIFLAVACLATALSASAILLVHKGNTDHMLIFVTKIIEGITASFLGPCLAALTLATFGPHHFDAVMASNFFWGHIGSVAAAILTGLVSYVMYPRIQFCFLVIGASAVFACFFVQYLPQGDPLMGRGFVGKVAINEEGHVEELAHQSDESTVALTKLATDDDNNDDDENPQAASYWEVFADNRFVILCLTGFFYHFANANVLLVLGEMMGQDKDDDGQSRLAIPLVAGAIVTAQITMAVATYAGNKLTMSGMGRKPLFLIGLVSLPVRCALIIMLKDSGNAALLSTQIFDGIGGGFIGLIQPYVIADITFGTGRFNVLMGVTASAFGLGATCSNYFGQMVVEKFGHTSSLMASFVISFAPIFLFLFFMPETLGMRTQRKKQQQQLQADSSTLYGSESRSTSYGSINEAAGVAVITT